MAEYGENEYFTPTQEEVAEREAQEALRRMVRTEIRRVQTGAADGDIADDIAREEQEKRAVAKRSREKAPFIGLWAYRLTLPHPITGQMVTASTSPDTETAPWSLFRDHIEN